MKVTLVSPFDPWPTAAETQGAHVGGVERVFAEVSRQLAVRGHDVTLLCSSVGPLARATHDGVRVVRAPRRMTVMRAPVARLHGHVERDADIVHVAATYPFTTPRVLRRAHQLGIPSVLDFHFEPAPGTLLGRAGASLYRRVGPRAYRWADAVLVRSLAYAQSAPSLAQVPRDRLRVVPNGIDTRRFNADAAPGPEGHLLFVGRLVPYKGVDVLLKALAKVPGAPPLLLVGDGPLRQRLQTLAKRLGVDARFLGHVPDDQLPALYRGARLTLLPSVTGQEAFGIALVESMACGTPVVASDLPGVQEVAAFGGLVCLRGDPDSLAVQIRRGLGPGALERGRSLAERTHATFSWQAVTGRIVDVYEEILSRRQAPAGARTEVMRPADPVGQPVL